MPAEIVATSVWNYLLLRMNAVHRQRSMGAFAGPPGIGKSTAIASFVGEHPGCVAVVKIAQPNAREGVVLQRTLEAVRRASGSFHHHSPTGIAALWRALHSAIREWSDKQTHRGNEIDWEPKLTIIYDEGQTLTPKSIEMQRHWNDGVDGLYPIGLIFVGNHEFYLDDESGGASFLSAAVVSRTTHLKTFSYSDLSDHDLSMVIEASGDVQPDALALLLNHCRSRRTNRDLRRLTRELDELAADAAGAPITAANVRTTLGLT